MKPYITQRIINLIPGMYMSSDKLDPEVKPPLEKNEEAKLRKTDLTTGH